MKTILRLATDVPFLSEAAMLAILAQVDRLDPLAAEHPRLKELRESLAPKATMEAGGVAVIPVKGILARDPDPMEMAFFGMESTDALAAEVNRAAKDPAAKAILLDVDSPGGYLTGGPELADAVKRAAAAKPVVAWTGGQMASMAYWVGSQASHVSASRSATLGSIGVYVAVADRSEMFKANGVKMEVFKNKEATFKGMGVPGTALTDDQRDYMKERAQRAFDEFRSEVLSARVVPPEAMKGQTFSGRESLANGLADSVGDRSWALAVARKLARQAARAG